MRQPLDQQHGDGHFDIRNTKHWGSLARTAGMQLPTDYPVPTFAPGDYAPHAHTQYRPILVDKLSPPPRHN